MGKIDVIAHRGASHISPENTMIAFKKAIEMGADAIETDVHLTKDGQLVLIHDERVNKTTNGKGYVKDYTLEELKELDAGSWFSETYRNQKIPTLDELFELVYPTPLWINIEIKMGFVLYPGIEEKLIQKIKDYHMENRVIISSFNHYSLVIVKNLDYKIRTGVLYVSGLYNPWDYAKSIGATSLHPSKEAVFPNIVQQAHVNGIAVYPYTVDKKKEMTSLINLGVDGIITNRPERLIQMLQQMK